MKNYYAVLGIPATASTDDIKIAYRQSAKRYHPDLNPGNDNYKKRFLEIKDAYEILVNPETKKKYDDELAVYLKAKQAHHMSARQVPPQNGNTQQAFQQNAGNRQTQQSAGFTSRQVPPQNGGNARQVPPQQSVPPQAQPRNQQVTAIEEMKKMHKIQLELLKSSAKEEMLKYKKRMQEQVNAFRKHAAIELEKAKKQYKTSYEKMAKETKQYKSEYKKNSFNAGFKKGLKEAKDSANITLTELKKLLVTANITLDGQAKDKNGNKKLQKIQMELSLAYDNNRELEQQIKLLEMEAKAAEKYGDRKIDELTTLLEEAEVRADELIAEQKKLKKKMQAYLEEIDELNEEVLHLEGFIEMWEEIGEKYKQAEISTEAEFEKIEKYDGTQRTQAKGTLYGVLGVFLNALPEEIDAAYERLSNRYDGKDKYIDRYIGIIEAYNILSDPEQKLIYDQSINNGTDI